MPRKRTQKATVAIIESAERTAKAIELRKSGATFKKIGDHFGISAQSAHEMVTKGLKATLAEPAAELRPLAVARLDHMLAAIWKAASNGDLRAQAMVLRIEERRAKLLTRVAQVEQLGFRPVGLDRAPWANARVRASRVERLINRLPPCTASRTAKPRPFHRSRARSGGRCDTRPRAASCPRPIFSDRDLVESLC